MFFQQLYFSFRILHGIFPKHHLVDGIGKLVMLKPPLFLRIAITVVTLFVEIPKKPKSSCNSLEKLLKNQNKKILQSLLW